MSLSPKLEVIIFPLLIEEGLGVVVDNKFLFTGILKVFFPTTTPAPPQ